MSGADTRREGEAGLSESQMTDLQDILTGWVSPHRKITCDCADQPPTYPTYRSDLHLEPCPWFYVTRLLAHVKSLEAELRSLRRFLYGGTLKTGAMEDDR